MERKEPAARLVNAFGDEVGGIYLMAVQQFLVLERIVYLRIGHGAGVEPNVNQVGLALHGFAVLRNEDDVVHVGAVQVYLVIVFLRIFARHEAFVLVGIALHEAGSHGLLYFVVKFFYGFDALLFRAVLGAPDGQRCTPVARTAQVPVVQVLEPLAEASRTR